MVHTATVSGTRFGAIAPDSRSDPITDTALTEQTLSDSEKIQSQKTMLRQKIKNQKVPDSVSDSGNQQAHWLSGIFSKLSLGCNVSDNATINGNIGEFNVQNQDSDEPDVDDKLSDSCPSFNSDVLDERNELQSEDDSQDHDGALPDFSISGYGVEDREPQIKCINDEGDMVECKLLNKSFSFSDTVLDCPQSQQQYQTVSSDYHSVPELQAAWDLQQQGISAINLVQNLSSYWQSQSQATTPRFNTGRSQLPSNWQSEVSRCSVHSASSRRARTNSVSQYLLGGSSLIQQQQSNQAQPSSYRKRQSSIFTNTNFGIQTQTSSQYQRESLNTPTSNTNFNLNYFNLNFPSNFDSPTASQSLQTNTVTVSLPLNQIEQSQNQFQNPNLKFRRGSHPTISIPSQLSDSSIQQNRPQTPSTPLPQTPIAFGLIQRPQLYQVQHETHQNAINRRRMSVISTTTNQNSMSSFTSSRSKINNDGYTSGDHFSSMQNNVGVLSRQQLNLQFQSGLDTIDRPADQSMQSMQSSSILATQLIDAKDVYHPAALIMLIENKITEYLQNLNQQTYSNYQMTPVYESQHPSHYTTNTGSQGNGAIIISSLFSKVLLTSRLFGNNGGIGNQNHASNLNLPQNQNLESLQEQEHLFSQKQVNKVYPHHHNAGNSDRLNHLRNEIGNTFKELGNLQIPVLDDSQSGLIFSQSQSQSQSAEESYFGNNNAGVGQGLSSQSSQYQTIDPTIIAPTLRELGTIIIFSPILFGFLKQKGTRFKDDHNNLFSRNLKMSNIFSGFSNSQSHVKYKMEFIVEIEAEARQSMSQQQQQDYHHDPDNDQQFQSTFISESQQVQRQSKGSSLSFSSKPSSPFSSPNTNQLRFDTEQTSQTDHHDELQTEQSQQFERITLEIFAPLSQKSLSGFVKVQWGNLHGEDDDDTANINSAYSLFDELINDPDYLRRTAAFLDPESFASSAELRDILILKAQKKQNTVGNVNNVNSIAMLNQYDNQVIQLFSHHLVLFSPVEHDKLDWLRADLEDTRLMDYVLDQEQTVRLLVELEMDLTGRVIVQRNSEYSNLQPSITLNDSPNQSFNDAIHRSGSKSTIGFTKYRTISSNSLGYKNSINTSSSQIGQNWNQPVNNQILSVSRLSRSLGLNHLNPALSQIPNMNMNSYSNCQCQLCGSVLTQTSGPAELQSHTNAGAISLNRISEMNGNIQYTSSNQNQTQDTMTDTPYISSNINDNDLYPASPTAQYREIPTAQSSVSRMSPIPLTDPNRSYGSGSKSPQSNIQKSVGFENQTIIFKQKKNRYRKKQLRHTGYHEPQTSSSDSIPESNDSDDYCPSVTHNQSVAAIGTGPTTINNVTVQQSAVIGGGLKSELSSMSSTMSEKSVSSLTCHSGLNQYVYPGKGQRGPPSEHSIITKDEQLQVQFNELNLSPVKLLSQYQMQNQQPYQESRKGSKETAASVNTKFTGNTDATQTSQTSAFSWIHKKYGLGPDSNTNQVLMCEQCRQYCQWYDYNFNSITMNVNAKSFENKQQVTRSRIPSKELSGLSGISAAFTPSRSSSKQTIHSTGNSNFKTIKPGSAAAQTVSAVAPVTLQDLSQQRQYSKSTSSKQSGTNLNIHSENQSMASQQSFC